MGPQTPKATVLLLQQPKRGLRRTWPPDLTPPALVTELQKPVDVASCLEQRSPLPAPDSPIRRAEGKGSTLARPPPHRSFQESQAHGHRVHPEKHLCPSGWAEGVGGKGPECSLPACGSGLATEVLACTPPRLAGRKARGAGPCLRDTRLGAEGWRGDHAGGRTGGCS